MLVCLSTKQTHTHMGSDEQKIPDRQTERQTDDKQTDSKTDRQTNTQTDRQTDRQTDKAIPLVFEHFGAWGEEARNFLRKLAAFSSDEVGQPNAPEFVDFWRKRFSVQLQKCNARVIQKKLNVLCGGCQIPESLSTQFFYH